MAVRNSSAFVSRGTGSTVKLIARREIARLGQLRQHFRALAHKRSSLTQRLYGAIRLLSCR